MWNRRRSRHWREAVGVAGAASAVSVMSTAHASCAAFLDTQEGDSKEILGLRKECHSSGLQESTERVPQTCRCHKQGWVPAPLWSLSSKAWISVGFSGMSIWAPSQSRWGHTSLCLGVFGYKSQLCDISFVFRQEVPFTS